MDTTAQAVEAYKIEEGRKFDGTFFHATMTIIKVDIPNNKLHVHIKLLNGKSEWEEEDWNLEHTIVGMRMYTYTRTRAGDQPA